MIIREATQADLPAVVALLADDDLGAHREAPGDPAYEAAFLEIDRDPRHVLLVAEAEDGAVVATVQLSFLPCLTHRGRERAQLEGVRVAAVQRGSGLGRALVADAVARARHRGAGVVQLTTDARRPGAHAFYEALGFRPTHVGFKLDLVEGEPPAE